MDIFEQASRLKLRFETSKGMLSVEDLWDIPLTSETGKANLDDIARDFFAQLKGTENVSFVNKEQKANATLQLSFDLVKHVIDVRLVENEAKAKAKANKEQKQRILEIIESKEGDALASKSVDELRAIAASL